jgi:hypothetical protein
MYARVVTFENAANIDETAKGIQDSDRPENLPATGFYMLADRAAGKVVSITLFATEEDMQKGHEVLNAMTPPGDGLGKRSSVDLMEVVAHMSA